MCARKTHLPWSLSVIDAAEASLYWSVFAWFHFPLPGVLFNRESLFLLIVWGTAKVTDCDFQYTILALANGKFLVSGWFHGVYLEISQSFLFQISMQKYALHSSSGPIFLVLTFHNGLYSIQFEHWIDSFKIIFP